VNVVAEIDAYLTRFGFNQVAKVVTKHKWGDALYIKSQVKPTPPLPFGRSCDTFVNMARMYGLALSAPVTSDAASHQRWLWSMVKDHVTGVIHDCPGCEWVYTTESALKRALEPDINLYQRLIQTMGTDHNKLQPLLVSHTDSLIWIL
jgi:hypothetical protein